MLLNASGCLDALTAPETTRALDAFVTKTVTPLPRAGNAPTRIAETDVGMLNSIGLANPGRERFLAENLPRLRDLDVPIWVSVGGFAAHEYAETCARLEDVTIELNLSCPNVDEAPESAAEIIAACRAATALPLYAKLSPAAWDVAAVAHAVEDAGADGLSLVNTMRGIKLDADLRPVLGTAGGGLSGPALKPIARRRLRLLPGDEPADRWHGRNCHGTRRARAGRGRCAGGRAGHDSLFRPVGTGPNPGGGVCRTGNTRPLVGRTGVRDRARRGVVQKKTPRRGVESLRKTPANELNRPQLTRSIKLLDSLV